jgi:hypothetical protein
MNAEMLDALGGIETKPFGAFNPANGAVGGQGGGQQQPAYAAQRQQPQQNTNILDRESLVGDDARVRFAD